MTQREDLIVAFLNRHGWGKARRLPLAVDASFRRYERLTLPQHRAVLMDAPPPRENVRPFIQVAEHLTKLGYSAPDILGRDEAAGLLLLEDLGDDTFTRLLARGEDEEDLYWLAVDLLIDLHGRGRDAIPVGVPAYDDDRFLTEVALLVDWYLPEMLGRPLAADQRDDYLRRWRDLLPTVRRVPETLVLRDFHVDNLMRLKRPGIAACGLLDFQDAVSGPIAYDLMSLLEDARRDVDPAVAHGLKRRYLDSFPDLDREAFAASWAILAAQRHAKVIGLFTRLWRRDGKALYLRHIPRVWRLLDTALAHPRLLAVRQWLDQTLPVEQRREPQP